VVTQMVACYVELSSIQFVNILRPNCNKNVHSLNLGCLHHVARVRSGDGCFYMRLHNVTAVG
jgi:hypothetical protein